MILAVLAGTKPCNNFDGVVVNCDRSVADYECGLQKLQRGAKRDQRIKEAAVAVTNFGYMDMKLHKAWTGQTNVKPGAMPPPLPCQHDVATWPMDDVLVYDNPKWQLFVVPSCLPDAIRPAPGKA